MGLLSSTASTQRMSRNRNDRGIGANAAGAGFYLLEKGLLVVTPRCPACGRVFTAPRSSGEKFGVSLEFMDADTGAHDGSAQRRLFFGSRLMVARTCSALAPHAEKSNTFIGERVLVATPNSPRQARLTLLFCESCGDNIAKRADMIAAFEEAAPFCESCGDNIASRTHLHSRHHYSWDRLVEFEPRGVMRRLRSFSPWSKRTPAPNQAALADGSAPEAIDPAIAGALADERVKAFFFARDLLLSGPCSVREMHMRALRAAAPLDEVEKALTALGATVVRGQDGHKSILPPEGFPDACGTVELEIANENQAANSPRRRGRTHVVAAAPTLIAANM
jgi:hypothetical protein